MNETLDHTEPRQEGCRCTLLSLCPECYARVEQERAEALMREWLRSDAMLDEAFGALPAWPNRFGWSPFRPRLRLVRRER